MHVREYRPFSARYVLLLTLVWQIFVGLDEATNPVV